MKSRKFSPHHQGWIESILDKEHINFLWDRIEDGNKFDVKDTLAGNISKSYEITDSKDRYFFNTILWPHVEMYRKINEGKDPLPIAVNAELELYLHDLWVNYQYQTEFNPYHFHGGMYSFVIWMKIPTFWREQYELSFLDGVDVDNKKASNFEFQYLDMLGNIKNWGYRLDPSMEGHMLFFPAKLMHTVYPFFNCDEPRISIAGNLWHRGIK